MRKKTFLGHPVGLYILFFTELWERFSFYGMRAILVLYMVAPASEGGLGWNDEKSLSIYGWYVLLVYVMAIPGGLIADRWIGQRKSVYTGGLLLCAGHLLLAYPPVWAFYSALLLIILGVGMLKPNISTMVGGLYEDGDPAKDAGFTIFYMGINVGAFLSSIAVGYLAYKYGWHYGFGLAGIGMIVGQIVFMTGKKYVEGTDAGSECKTVSREEKTHFKLTVAEKKRLVVVCFSFLIVLIFWAAYEQAGGLLNLYTERYTDRDFFGFEIPTAWYQSLNPLYIMIFAPAVAGFWIYLGKIRKEPSAIAKMGLGTVILGAGFILMVFAALERETSLTGKSSMIWLFTAYFLHTIGELALSPVSLSFITDTAPKRMTSQVMGWYFAVTGVGGWLAAEIGIFAETSGETTVFGSIAVFTIVFGLILMVFAPAINRIAHEKDEAQICR